MLCVGVSDAIGLCPEVVVRCVLKYQICLVPFCYRWWTERIGWRDKSNHSTEQAKRDGRKLRVGVRLQGVPLLYLSRNTNHIMHIVRFESAQRAYQLTGNNGKN
jgi:hypothetical protein